MGGRGVVDGVEAAEMGIGDLALLLDGRMAQQIPSYP